MFASSLAIIRTISVCKVDYCDSLYTTVSACIPTSPFIEYLLRNDYFHEVVGFFVKVIKSFICLLLITNMWYMFIVVVFTLHKPVVILEWDRLLLEVIKTVWSQDELGFIIDIIDTWAGINNLELTSGGKLKGLESAKNPYDLESVISDLLKKNIIQYSFPIMQIFLLKLLKFILSLFLF